MLLLCKNLVMCFMNQCNFISVWLFTSILSSSISLGIFIILCLHVCIAMCAIYISLFLYVWCIEIMQVCLSPLFSYHFCTSSCPSMHSSSLFCMWPNMWYTLKKHVYISVSFCIIDKILLLRKAGFISAPILFVHFISSFIIITIFNNWWQYYECRALLINALYLGHSHLS